MKHLFILSLSFLASTLNLTAQAEATSYEETCLGLSERYLEGNGLDKDEKYILAGCIFYKKASPETKNSIELGFKLLKEAKEEGSWNAISNIGFWYKENGPGDNDSNYYMATEAMRDAVLYALDNNLPKTEIEKARLNFIDFAMQAGLADPNRTQQDKQLIGAAIRLYNYMLGRHDEADLSNAGLRGRICARYAFDPQIQTSLNELKLNNYTREVWHDMGSMCLKMLSLSDDGLLKLTKIQKEEWADSIRTTHAEPLLQKLIESSEGDWDKSPMALFSLSRQEAREYIYDILVNAYMYGELADRDVDKAYQFAVKAFENSPSANTAGMMSSLASLTLLTDPGASFSNSQRLAFLETLDRFILKSEPDIQVLLMYSKGLLEMLPRIEAMRSRSYRFPEEKKYRTTFITASQEHLKLLPTNTDILDPKLFRLFIILSLSDTGAFNKEKFWDNLILAAEYLKSETGDEFASLFVDSARSFWEQNNDFSSEKWLGAEFMLGNANAIPYVLNHYGLVSEEDDDASAVYLANMALANLCMSKCRNVEDQQLSASEIANLKNRTSASFVTRVNETAIMFEDRFGTPLGLEYIRKTAPAYLPKHNIGRNLALLVSVQNYENFSELQTPKKDAMALADLLKNKFGFETETLVNPTRKEIFLALQKYESALNKEDNFILFFAGHGKEIKNVNYWLPADAEEERAFDWINEDDIKRSLAVMDAQNILVIADACFSGSLLRGVKPADQSAPKNMAFEILKGQKSRVAITSGGVEEVLDGGFGNHSVFMEAVLSRLSKSQEKFGARRLHSDIQTDVLKRSIALGGKQTPDYDGLLKAGHEGGDFVFEPIN